MSSTAPEPPVPFARPRPGVVKTLGILNIVISILMSTCLLSSMSWVYMATMRQKSPTPATVEVTTSVPAAPAGPVLRGGRRMTLAIDPFAGMDDPNMIRFSIADISTAMILNGVMFATGIGLINLKRWGARWWTYAAWFKIIRVWLFWGFFIVAVAPSFSESMARAALNMFPQGPGRGRVPTMAEFTRVYSIMNLFVGLGMILFGTIYPAISLWMLSRPGVKAALIDKTPATEPEPS